MSNEPPVREHANALILNMIATGIANYKKCLEKARLDGDEILIGHYTRKIEERERFHERMKNR